MSRVIFLRTSDVASRNAWAHQWVKEGHDRVLVDPALLGEAVNPCFVNEVESIAVATAINILVNAIRLGRHVCVNIDTDNLYRLRRLETVARQAGGDIQWLEL